jgi:uncharacterized protein (TIGR01319 family)
MIEKLILLNTTHPDIIMLCGGTDGGASHSVYRLAEMIKQSNITSKFTERTHIPLIYAGNIDATDYIQKICSPKFDLHILPNIKPSIKVENLEPAKNKIHQIFLNNVMEQAPGYWQVKEKVNAGVLPTPSAVLKAFKLMGNKYGNVVAFDIGGATTDIYSNIGAGYQRSVSGNMGMSYSIGNVLAECDFDVDVKRYFNSNYKYNDCGVETSYFFNYVGNKILYPDYNPNEEHDIYIEHIMAVACIKMALSQHIQLHYRIKNKNLYKKLCQMTGLGIISENLSDMHYYQRKLFKIINIDVIIGAGGVITHATPEQAIFIMIESLKPDGITRLWRDKHFVSPHFGVLSEVNKDIAQDLLFDECLEELAVYIRSSQIIYIDGKRIKIKINKF